MTAAEAKKIVLDKYPMAVCEKFEDINRPFVVWSDKIDRAFYYGTGDTKTAAWINAAKTIKL